MTKEELKKKFAKLQSESESRFFGFEEFSSSLYTLIGLQHGRPALLVSGNFVCPQINSSEAIEVEITPSDQYCRVFFIESDLNYHDLFINVCLDLLSVIQNIKNPERAISNLIARFEAWKKFWKSKNECFTKEQTRGLFGELAYLDKCLDNGTSAIDVVRAWQGPTGSDQDFIFKNQWAEIKTIQPNASEITISSLEQLAPTIEIDSTYQKNSNGLLVIIRLQEIPVSDDALTLKALHKKIKERLEQDPYALQVYRGTIEISGANMNDGKNETSLKFQIIEIKTYSASSNDFPKLVRNNDIPNAITKVKYNLSVNALQQWIIEE